jgi:hypothetical protein
MKLLVVPVNEVVVRPVAIAVKLTVQVPRLQEELFTCVGVLLPLPLSAEKPLDEPNIIIVLAPTGVGVLPA